MASKAFMKKLILALMLVGIAQAQNTGQNVVTKRVIASQVVSANTTFTSAPIQNIGQSSHILKVLTSNINATYALSASIQGSIDGVTYFNIGPVTTIQGLTAIVGPFTLTATGTQSFPFIRTNIIVTTPGPITVIATYTGNSSPAIVQSDLSNNISGTVNTTIAYTLPVTNNSIGPLITATTQEVVYGLDLFLPSTATHFNINCNVTTANSILAADNAVATHIQEPTGIRPFGTCPVGENLQVTIAGTGTAYLTVVQRYE